MTDNRSNNRDRSAWIDTGRKDSRGRPVYALPDDVKLLRYLVKLDNGCWERRACNGAGYGKVKAFGEEFAHRASWVMHNGPIPDGLWVLHRCDNPPCINPDHLFLGTCADNVADMMAKGRGPDKWLDRSVEMPSSKRRARAREIQRRYADGEGQQALAAEYGLHPATVSRIVRGVAHPVPAGESLPRRVAKPHICKRGHDWSVTPPYLAHRRDGSVSRRCRLCQIELDHARKAAA